MNAGAAAVVEMPSMKNQDTLGGGVFDAEIGGTSRIEIPIFTLQAIIVACASCFDFSGTAGLIVSSRSSVARSRIDVASIVAG